MMSDIQLICEVPATVNIRRIACRLSDSVSRLFTNISPYSLLNVFIFFFLPLALQPTVGFGLSDNILQVFLSTTNSRYLLTHST